MKSSQSFSKRAQFIAVATLSAVVVVTIGLAASFQWNQPPQATMTPKLSSPAVSPLPPSPPNLTETLPSPPLKPAVPVIPTPAEIPVTPQNAPPPAFSQPVQEIHHSGHLAYKEAEPSRLVEVGRYVRGDYERSEQLDIDAAAAFQQMQTAAASEGIQLMPISGFRSVAEQKKLFDRQIQRQGSAEAAAKLSAPPGYSEHHTGYAIDIADVTRPETDLKFEFENTEAYRWLRTHANAYGFELSFLPDNQQGVSFEPWHWRFINSNRARATFAMASGF